VPAIEVWDLVKSYDGSAAVAGLSLAVESGEIVGLVGPNGAGKTSTLRCLAGILPPTSGRIVVAGHDLVTEPVEARRHLAFVPDEPRLFDSLTVTDHMKVVARIYGVADGAERARELLDRFELGERAEAFPAELSRGMKQKLMIAAALLHRPAALVLDEPLTGLDPDAMRRMQRILVEQAAAGAAVLFSSRLFGLVRETCGRVVLVQRGRQVLAGTPAEVQAALPGVGPDAALEEIFVSASEGKEVTADPQSPGGSSAEVERGT
jgi:ABC-2 type transport system ATP-binding protein